ncbi:MAG TPA: WhiB family transcriptional regulator [Streptosporangiaceae bacterium]|nr:WhiB family transcriptional regulator [Streptosporangiaceae bacterium]
MSLPAWSWADRAACKGTDPDAALFFGLDGERGPERDKREAAARTVCAPCPVRIACLDYAIANAERYGTWGGFSEDERAAERRRQMRRAARKQAAA